MTGEFTLVSMQEGGMAEIMAPNVEDSRTTNNNNKEPERCKVLQKTQRKIFKCLLRSLVCRH